LAALCEVLNRDVFRWRVEVCAPACN
jgi:hypothetical protein